MGGDGKTGTDEKYGKTGTRKTGKNREGEILSKQGIEGVNELMNCHSPFRQNDPRGSIIRANGLK